MIKCGIDFQEDDFQFITFPMVPVACRLANETSQRQARKSRALASYFDIQSLDGVVGIVQLGNTDMPAQLLQYLSLAL
jgi:hypothetical protein